LVDAGPPVDNPGVVDERTDTAEPVGGVEQPGHVGLAAQVASHGDGRSGPGPAELDDGLRLGAGLAIADADPPAPLGEEKGRGCSDAAACAGYDAPLARERSHAGILPRRRQGFVGWHEAHGTTIAGRV